MAARKKHKPRRHKHKWVPRGAAAQREALRQMFGGATVTMGEGSRLWTCRCGTSSIGPKPPG